jgi:hypothetical protein
MSTAILKEIGFSGNVIAFVFNLISLRELEKNYGWLDLKNWACKGFLRVA